ncbi:MAG TPA: hypothetical protein VGJ79_05310 [Candidatus Dormibacteraeota bacterium]
MIRLSRLAAFGRRRMDTGKPGTIVIRGVQPAAAVAAARPGVVAR